MATQMVFVQSTFLKTLEEDLRKLESMSEVEKSEHLLKSYQKTLESDFADSRKYHANLLKMDSKCEVAIVQQYLQDETMSKIRENYHAYWAELSACLDAKVRPILTSTSYDNYSSLQSEKKIYIETSSN